VYNFLTNNFYLLDNFLFLSVLIYLLVYFFNIGSIFILINSNQNSNNIFKILKNLILIKRNYYYFLLIFASLAGLPPLSIFISKFFLSFLVFYKHGIIFCIIFYAFIILNFFFYIQFFKLIKKQKYLNSDISNINKNFKINKFFKYFILNIFIFFILFFLFYFKDFIFIFYFLMF